MLFHVTHKHNHTSCSAHHPEKQEKFAQTFELAEKTGIKVIGSYVDAPGHTVYMILDAESALQIAQFFDPILELGDAEIHPVADSRKLLEQLKR